MQIIKMNNLADIHTHSSLTFMELAGQEKVMLFEG